MWALHWEWSKMFTERDLSSRKAVRYGKVIALRGFESRRIEPMGSLKARRTLT